MTESESGDIGTRVLVLDQDEGARSGIVIKCGLVGMCASLDMAFDASVFVYHPSRAKPWLPSYDNGKRYRNRPKRRPRGK